jgi:putative transcriptional regulator
MTRRPATPIHNRIAVLRAERGLSRQDLADALDINYQTVGYIERGEYNPSLDLAFAIAALFELPLEAVFSAQPFEPMSARLYGRTADTSEPAGRTAEAREPAAGG